MRHGSALTGLAAAVPFVLGLALCVGGRECWGAGEEGGAEANRTVYVVLFTSSGCPECKPGVEAVKKAVAGLAGIELVVRDVSQHEDFELFQCLAERAGLDPGQILAAPSVFVDTDYLDMLNHSGADVRRLVQKYRATGTGRFFEITATDRANAQSAHIERFQRFGVPAIVVAGLIDGVNPCAFATVLFFLSYLAWLGRSRRDILLSGLFFAAGLLVPYYLLGAGILHFTRALSVLPEVRNLVFHAVAVGAAILGVVSLMDASKARAGRSSEMVLALPRFLKTSIHKTVRDTTGLGIVGGAFAAGLLIAFLEAICTGQIYLPTLMYVAGISTLRYQALTYLLLYNLAFITPLLVVVGVVYIGSSSQTIARFVEKHVAAAKIAIGVAFLLIAALLAVTAGSL